MTPRRRLTADEKERYTCAVISGSASAASTAIATGYAIGTIKRWVSLYRRFGRPGLDGVARTFGFCDVTTCRRSALRGRW